MHVMASSCSSASLTVQNLSFAAMQHHWFPPSGLSFNQSVVEVGPMWIICWKENLQKGTLWTSQVISVLKVKKQSQTMQTVFKAFSRSDHVYWDRTCNTHTHTHTHTHTNFKTTTLVAQGNHTHKAENILAVTTAFLPQQSQQMLTVCERITGSAHHCGIMLSLNSYTHIQTW